MSQPLKILFCIDSLARGGTELQLVGLIDRLDRDRFAPYLCTIRPTDTTLTPGDCPHIALHVPRLFAPDGLLNVIRLADRLRRERFGVVHTFFQDSTIVGGTAARLARVPLRLASFRDLGFWRTRSQELVLRRVFPWMTGFLANSEVVRDHFVEADGLDPARFRVISNGIDVASLPWVEHTGSTRHVGIVGNLNRRVKRTDLFIRAAGLVGAEHPEITWHILGDGQFRTELENLAREVGLSDGQVVFTGRCANVADYLEKLQIGVLCSDSEGFSNALLEYMLKGCAAVATAVGGNREALTHGETGLLVPPGDVEALAAAIDQLVVAVPLRCRLADNARRFAEAEFSWDRCVAAHERVYLEGISANG